MRTIAVVVTYNRLNLLKQAILCLQNQTVKLDEILVINNASTDGTKEYLATLEGNINYVNLETNLGGAGGFQYGIRLAYEHKADYVWIMDDDTLAEKDALEALLNGMEILKGKNWGILASNVLYKDNKACIMNIPHAVFAWNELLREGIVQIESASFVGMLVKREVIEVVGLPIKEFFLWGDDVEYSRRITKEYEGYLIGDSTVKHYMEVNEGADIFKTSKERIDRFFYSYRNYTYMAKRKGIRCIVGHVKGCVHTMFKILLTSNNKWKKIKTIFRGVVSGLFFSPQIEYVNKIDIKE